MNSLFLAWALLSAPHLYRAPFISMGTKGEFAAWISEDSDAASGFARAQAALARVNDLMRPFGDSELARLNARAGRGPVSLSLDTFTVLQRAQKFSRESGGLFDVTFASLGSLWRFDGPASLPTEGQVAAARSRIDYRRLVLDAEASAATLMNGETQVGLGGIAKGYGIDLAVSALRASGVKDFVLKLGGDLYVSGSKGEDAWMVGIADPRGTDSFAELALADAAFSTSGDNEHFFIAGGKRYHHIIDPRTGYPAAASRSVTILAPDATTAEGLSKILFIAGAVQADKYLAMHEGCEAVIVTAENRLWISAGLRSRLRVLHLPSP